MKFLIDAQFPARLARLLNEHDHDATHTSELPNGNRTPDDEIGVTADAEDRVVVSKDREFRYSHFLKTSPRRLALDVGYGPAMGRNGNGIWASPEIVESC